MSENSLALIEAAGLLQAEDAKALSMLGPELRHTFETAQVFRTPTEMRLSVLNDFKRPTADAKYWQAVREQDVFVNELVSLSYEYRKVLIDIKRLEKQLAGETDEIERESLELEIEHKQWIGQQMSRTAHHRVREIRAWSQIKAELLPQLKYGDANVDAHQLEAMRLRWMKEAALVNEHTPPADARNILGLAHAASKEAG